jgi:hypothetical protein
MLNRECVLCRLYSVNYLYYKICGFSLCPTEGLRTSRPLQLASVKCEKSMNICLFNYNAVFHVLLAALCIFVIYKCLSWDFVQQ